METGHAWAAGVIDSDGCITIKRRVVRGPKPAVYYSLFVIVGMSSANGIPAVLGELQSLYGGSINSNDERRPLPNRLPRYQWQVAAAQAEAMVRQIEPYLIGKLDQAQLAIEYRDRAVGRGKGALAASYYQQLRDTKHYTVSRT